MRTEIRLVIFIGLFLGLSGVRVARGADEVFLFSYFTGNGEDGLHLARSEDGMHWRALHAGGSFLQPTVGEDKLMRDPCLLLGPDHVFRLVWTTSWWGHTIGYARSRDLIHWEDQQAIPVMAGEPTAVNCWAPEVVYDAARREYLIYWATTIPGRFAATDETGRSGPAQHMLNHRIYSTTTRDFAAFTPTRLYYDGGFDVIDATLAQAGHSWLPFGKHKWLLFVKNETERPKAEKNIRLVRAETATGPFSPPSAPITGNYWAEGPTSIRIGPWWYVYFDRYREKRFGVVRSRDLAHWEDLSDQLQMPAGIRHGTVLRVPRALADALP
jgi:hypothetical protein